MEPGSIAPDGSQEFKEQARRLKTFLAAGGIEIKHSHALEAVAQMHGFADFHLLKHAASTTTSHGSVWLIATFGAGILPELCFSDDFDNALRGFLSQVARFAAQHVQISVRAQEKGRHAGLYALNSGAIICSMTRPAKLSIEGASSEREALPFSNMRSMASVADEVTFAMSQTEGGWREFEERVHDERFWQQIEARLEDTALRGASVTSPEFKMSAAAVDAVIRAAQQLRISLEPQEGALSEEVAHAKRTR